MRQINIQMSLNPQNKSHMDLLEWMNEQTKNKSSFIRETMFMRMVGIYGVRSVEVQSTREEIGFDQNEILKLIQV